MSDAFEKIFVKISGTMLVISAPLLTTQLPMP